MCARLNEQLIRLAKENGWRITQSGRTIVLSKGRSVVECPDNKRAYEFLTTNSI